ncbi:hypothetical protein QFC19_008837 [Naganishia cerealis]|uniref:Uncharacterized protein n=1 Tax=Naganishia cerealis TaxID=610337 RepID=A0ACC2UYA0_9TREE|nr:hypothetical protein QFC19_008837 [Naganishia cerealis]
MALGPQLKDVHEESWKIFKEEKRNNMLTGVVTFQLVVLDFPMNCEPRRADLVKSHITPNDIHYVRNHGGIPTVQNIDAYSIKVGGLVKNPGELFFKDLVDPAKFPQEEMTVTLQCSGTRRVEQIALYPGEGDGKSEDSEDEFSSYFRHYAYNRNLRITQRGVQMKHVLEHFGGVLPEGLHVETIGADTYFKKNKVFNYAVSIPYRKVKMEEAFLAYEMNGVPLPRIHGGPLRLVVPGVIGARSTKWVYEINVLPEPSMGPVQRQEYLYYPQQVGKQNVTYDKGFSIQDMPVSSAILVPKDKEVIVHDGYIHCEGWAYSGGGHWVERVEVSIDGGFIWHEASYYTMRLWKVDVPVPVEGWIELVVRAWNSAINTQPTIVRNAWNWTLHVTSSAHRVPVYSVNRSRPETAARLRLFEEHGESIKPITFPTDVPIQSEEEYLAAMAKRGPREPSG